MRASFLLPQRIESGRFYPEPPLQSSRLQNFYTPLPDAGTVFQLSVRLDSAMAIYYRVQEWQMSWFITGTETATDITATSQGTVTFPAQGLRLGSFRKQVQDERFLGPGYSGLEVADEANLAALTVLINPIQPPANPDEILNGGAWIAPFGIFATIAVGIGVSEAEMSGGSNGPSLDFFGYTNLALNSIDAFNYPMTGFIQIQPSRYWPYELPAGGSPLFNTETGAPLESV